MSIETEPQQRLDWKAKAARAETNLKAIRRRLARIKRAAEKPPRAPKPRKIRMSKWSRELNDRLNKSEARLTRKIGKRRVAALVEAFKAEAGDSFDGGLWVDLYAQHDPYGWIYQRSTGA